MCSDERANLKERQRAATRAVGRWQRALTASRWPDAYVSIRTGKSTNGRANLYWRCGWYVWNNTGDRAVLRTSTGALYDYCNYGGGDVAKDCD